MQQPAQFSIVPDEQQLLELDRQFGFSDTVSKTPETLTPAETEHYLQQGYLSGIGIFTESEAAANREYFDELLSQALAEGKDSYSISTAHMKHGRVYDLLTNEKIVACVRDLLGEDVVGWGSHFFCKTPGDGKSVAWHQDCSYWPLTPTKTLTVWLAIDDVDCENGCMQVIPRSHQHGHIAYRESENEEGNVLNQTIDGIESFGSPVPVELAAGEISIHSDLLLHGSEANNSNRRRCGLTLRYCPADVRAHLGWNAKGVIVSGVDSAGHWGNPARPAVD